MGLVQQSSNPQPNYSGLSPLSIHFVALLFITHLGVKALANISSYAKPIQQNVILKYTLGAAFAYTMLLPEFFGLAAINYSREVPLNITLYVPTFKDPSTSLTYNLAARTFHAIAAVGLAPQIVMGGVAVGGAGVMTVFRGGGRWTNLTKSSAYLTSNRITRTGLHLLGIVDPKLSAALLDNPSASINERVIHRYALADHIFSH